MGSNLFGKNCLNTFKISTTYVINNIIDIVNTVANLTDLTINNIDS